MKPLVRVPVSSRRRFLVDEAKRRVEIALANGAAWTSRELFNFVTFKIGFLHRPAWQVWSIVYIALTELRLDGRVEKLGTTRNAQYRKVEKCEQSSTS